MPGGSTNSWSGLYAEGPRDGGAGASSLQLSVSVFELKQSTYKGAPLSSISSDFAMRKSGDLWMLNKCAMVFVGLEAVDRGSRVASFTPVPNR